MKFELPYLCTINRRTNSARPMTRFASALAVISCLWGLVIGSTQVSVYAEPVGDWTIAEPTLTADSLLLDQYPNARAAYSLEKLRSDYSGPAIRARRSSDGAEQDFGYTSGGNLDISAIESWLGPNESAKVIKWYSQLDGHPAMTKRSFGTYPLIAENGTVFTDGNGNPRMKFDNSPMEVTGLPAGVTEGNWSFLLGYEHAENSPTGNYILQIGRTNKFGGTRPSIKYRGDRETKLESQTEGIFGGQGAVTVSAKNRTLYGGLANVDNEEWWIYDRNSEVAHQTNQWTDESVTWTGFTLGAPDRQSDSEDDWKGWVYEFVMYPTISPSGYIQRYDILNSGGKYGPENYNKDALLTQQFRYQIKLYDWLEALSESDVTLPGGTISWDGTYANKDKLADLWLQTRSVTASSVIRSEPGGYVLNNGNGKGIEATGSVKIPDEPRGAGGMDESGYEGNPPRSWSNEPAFLYQLDIPMSGGGQGNPWYQNPELGRRAMVVAIVDLMMHHRNVSNNVGTVGYDMQGKAMLGWAETYRWCKEVVPSNVQDAFETGFEKILDEQIEKGPKGANTNMDMFALHGYADMYMATDDSALKTKLVEATKAALFGFKDGELETNHKLFAFQNRKGGVFSPAGPILEGDQPESFYQGESIYQLMGALAAVTDRETGNTLSDWTFLKEVVRRAREWRSYQAFYDPKDGASDKAYISSGSGFSGRTSYGVNKAQANFPWKRINVAYHFRNSAYRGWAPDPSSMETQINNSLSFLNGEMDKTYTNAPDNWRGWSPWTKPTPYLPPEGWWSELNNLENNNDPRLKWPIKRSNVTWNKALGGLPEGETYWSYRQKDGRGGGFGFFIEAVPKQGIYGGWYGGKIETFWTKSTGIVMMTRHGKAGCDRTGVDDYSNNEDSKCWFNIDEKAAQHVWGRDENGNAFSTLLLRGWQTNRTSVFNTDGSPPTVTVNNIFNDPGLARPGEETGSEIEGSFEVENKFEAQSNGLGVTHILTSDETDQVTELWASFPVYLRHYNPHRGGGDHQENMDDTSIEYFDGSAWNVMPEDTSGNGTPEIVNAEAMRLGRDYEDGNGLRYAYVDFASNQDVRLSKHKYYDPYQSKTGVRTVHIDLHGDPGTTKTLPASKSVSYTIQTTDPTSGGDTSTSQVIPLQKGWNIVSTSVSPSAPAMDSVFAGIQSEITVVKNEAGERYRPGEDTNEIGQWNIEEAYFVHAKSDASLSIQGDSLGSPSITLEEGWNLVPYFPSSPLPVGEAVSSITENLVLVKDETGHVYLPDEGIEDLSQMRPGEGYRVYVQQATTLTYPDGGN